jgi:hypothetical protein
MSDLITMMSAAAGQVGGEYQISRSLRFNSADSAYLDRTPASAGDRKTWTWSAWVKRGKLGIDAYLFSSGTDASNLTLIRFISSDILRIYTYNLSVSQGQYLDTSAVFRDPSAWYHIVGVHDTTQATAANRLKLYVNGVQQTGTMSGAVDQNSNGVVNSTNQHILGPTSSYSSQLFDGYMTEVNFIDGQALTPSSFGETNATTGVWTPIKFNGPWNVGTGVNGFYLKFSNNSDVTAATLGADYSGNGNNWTPSGFSVTAGAGNDSLVDTPTPYGTDTGAGGEVRGNYCTLNSVSPLASGTLANGNLNFTTGTSDAIAVGTMAVSSGKWYWEVTATTVSAANAAIGIIGQPPSSLIVDLRTASNGYAYLNNGNKGNNNSTSAYGASYTSADVIGVALDLDAGTLVFYKNNSSQGTAYSSLSGTFAPALSDGRRIWRLCF